MHEVVDALLVGHVETEGDSHFAGDAREPLDATRADHDPVTPTPQGDRGRGPDARRSSRDNSDRRRSHP